MFMPIGILISSLYRVESESIILPMEVNEVQFWSLLIYISYQFEWNFNAL